MASGNDNQNEINVINDSYQPKMNQNYNFQKRRQTVHEKDNFMAMTTPFDNFYHIVPRVTLPMTPRSPSKRVPFDHGA